LGSCVNGGVYDAKGLPTGLPISWLLPTRLPTGIGFLDVKGCLKFFRVAFRRFSVWSFSMLSSWGFLLVVSPVYGYYILDVVDGGKRLD
jgi:hypothetical protein